MGGASWGCAAAADVLLVVLGPLVVVYLLAAQMQQLHLTCLSATWRLIRGKQKVGAGDEEGGLWAQDWCVKIALCLAGLHCRAQCVLTTCVYVHV